MRSWIATLAIIGMVCLYIVLSDASLMMKVLGVLLIGPLSLIPISYLAKWRHINRLPIATLLVDNHRVAFHYQHFTTATGQSLYQSIVDPFSLVIFMATDVDMDEPNDERAVRTVPATLYFLEQQIRFSMTKILLAPEVAGVAHIFYDGGLTFIVEDHHFRGHISYLSDGPPGHRRSHRKQGRQFVPSFPKLAPG